MPPKGCRLGAGVGSSARETADRRGQVTRRRGAALEAAILQAVRDELDSVGVADLTMAGIAARAGTSKAVLYRRWPNRGELLVAALRREESPADADPDTGNLREDVLILLGRLSRRYVRMGRRIAQSLLSEYVRDPEIGRYLHNELAGAEIMTAILERAAKRGEVELGVVTPRIASLPVDLVRHELFVTGAAVPEATLREIVDDIFLPLAGARSGQGPV